MFRRSSTPKRPKVGKRTSSTVDVAGGSTARSKALGGQQLRLGEDDIPVVLCLAEYQLNYDDGAWYSGEPSTI